MKCLVIGGGGREHALVWTLSRSKQKPKIFCAPGNAGTIGLAESVSIPSTDLKALLAFAKKEKIDLTVVGPEAPLALGVVDLFKSHHLPVFGPTQAAARLESSKVHAKTFCDRYNIPQAPFKIFTDAAVAKRYLQRHVTPVVIKADGLAAGKGVSVCQGEAEAFEAIDQMLVRKKFGDAGGKIVIEDFLKGEEASFIAAVDGDHILPLSSAKDHKRLLDQDKGPNTGGMGAFSPASVITPTLYEKIMEKIMLPAVRGSVTEGAPFVGFLYAGLMIVGGEPFLLEFNVRMGDPEAEAILPRLKTGLVEVLEAALAGRLNEVLLSWETQVASCVVMASEGYPEKVETGYSIQGLDLAAQVPDALVFHGGTRLEKGAVVTAGGRVLVVTGLGKDLPESLRCAYEAVSKISWQGCYYRRDIGGYTWKSRL